MDRKPTVAQRMNRKQSTGCAWCPEPIQIADEAVIATTVHKGRTYYTLVHKTCQEDFESVTD